MSIKPEKRVFLVRKIDVAAVNAQLEKEGYGPDNFSVPMNTGPIETHMACEAFLDSAAVKAFQNALESRVGSREHVRKRLSDVASEEGLVRKVIEDPVPNLRL